MCSFDGVRRGNYLGGEPVERAEVEVRVGKLKIGFVPEDGRSAVIVPLYKGKGEEV